MIELGQMTNTLLLVGLLSGGVLLAVRRFLPFLSVRTRPGNPLAHLGTLTLTPQCSVALIRAGQEELLLGLTSHTLTLLSKPVPASRLPVRCETVHSAMLYPTRLRRLRKLPPRSRKPIATCQLSFFPKRRG